MKAEAYKSMYELEESHWWYMGLRGLVVYFIKRYAKNKDVCILDAGCGTGFNLKLLDKLGESYGIDYSDAALDYCKERKINRVVKACIEDIPFKDKAFDVVVSLDVLYHKNVEDDIKAIKDMARVTKDNGIIVLNLPAHEHLKRSHDDAVDTIRRYNKADLLDKLKKNGLKPLKMTYRCSFLYPVIFLLSRRKKDDAQGSGSDLKMVATPINMFLLFLLKLENFLIRFADLPIGTSVFCVAKKN